MKNITKYLIAAVSALTLFLQSGFGQSVVGGLIASHPKVAAFVVGLSSILALIHKPAEVPAA